MSDVQHEPGPWNGGNILIRTDGQPPVLYIVDWDDVLLAPKESDLMFVGGGIDEIWKTERERSYGWFQRNFEPEATIEMADATYN